MGTFSSTKISFGQRESAWRKRFGSAKRTCIAPFKERLLAACGGLLLKTGGTGGHHLLPSGPISNAHSEVSERFDTLRNSARTAFIAPTNGAKYKRGAALALRRNSATNAFFIAMSCAAFLSTQFRLDSRSSKAGLLALPLD